MKKTPNYFAFAIDIALDYLRDGHTIYKLSTARGICQTLGVEYPKHLEKEWYSDKTGNPKGLRMDEEGSWGVYSLELSRYMAVKLGVADKAKSCLGRGSQARAYVDVIEQKLRSKT